MSVFCGQQFLELVIKCEIAAKNIFSTTVENTFLPSSEKRHVAFGSGSAAAVAPPPPAGEEHLGQWVSNMTEGEENLAPAASL